ncbi:metallophosphoesterase [Cocleimonas sp. KMM 6892]|uniref:metallophosphoesterase family protein n=1 Tax=unclassified Cocleimonas TaxID=2639732 RepID=UPI002DB56651|nr:MULTISPECIES: metallophosphoesterase [unclassified Cocleimonas]MEB8431748.1 metallophosphoesterase [Cocleimonas sp. KMM 6892]MEC4715166.1 metallophosphoesterase [Cocleimonas sp. KMM 6895]MEC4744020.1 metallophosphoesterase [Cocleimonas sp. KMM 6896]
MINNSTRSRKRNDAGKRLFTYAVIADTHLNEDEDNCNSPFDVNRLANRRLRYVVNDLNTRDLALVFHLGDVVHPVPSMDPLYAESAARFHEQMSALRHPLHVIPGNHDVGDKFIAWGPAGTVNDLFLQAWTEYFGDHYFYVSHDGIAFIGINAQLIGSGLSMEQEQKAWLEYTLQELNGERIYLFTHYPPFLADADEPEHYDNISEAGRGWLLALLKKHNVEALFAGHVHHFWYNQVDNCQCYLLPSTAFTRQDYAEMFHVGSAAEFGRNDEAKLGYLLVHVHEQGHYVEMVRCYGNETADNESTLLIANKLLRYVNPETNKVPVLGFDLRQDWAEMVQIPPSGGLDEFDRKWVRNDYALLALLEMGVKSLRIPFADIMNLNRRKRLHEMQKLGFEFTLFSFGIPEDAFELEVAKALSTLISAWEISWPVERLDELYASIAKLPSDIDCLMTFSALRSKADIMESGRTYYHVINHGYTPSDKHLSDQLTQSINNHFSAYVLRCGFLDSVWNTVNLAAETNKKTGLQSSIHLRLSADNPAENMTSESFICKRLAEAMIYGWLFKIDTIYCDTLATNDRGYFPREGVIDRLYNPKPGYYLVKHIHAFLTSIHNKSVTSIDSKIIEFDQKNENTLLRVKLEDSQLILAISTNEVCLKDVVSNVIEDKSGEIHRLNWLDGTLQELTTDSDYSSRVAINRVEDLGIEILIA